MRDGRALSRMDEETRAIHLKLEAWGSWAKEMEVQGWPESIFGHLGAVRAPVVKPPIAMPEEIAKVDGAVARLCEIDKKVVRRYYIHWEAPEVSAAACKMRLRQFQNVLRRARWRLLPYLSLCDSYIVERAHKRA